VLFDRFFSSARYGARLNRSYWVAAAAPPGGGDTVPKGGYGDQLTIFDSLQAAGVGWKFYVQDYNPKETFRVASRTDPAGQAVRVPLLNYPRFLDRPELRSHIVDLDQYYSDLAHGTLPAVSFVSSSGASERSVRSIPAGQTMVRNMITQLMTSRYWGSSALMWSYDGAGGWFDHVPPPTSAGERLGLRVPALLVSPYARPGHVDHTVLEYPSALKFIEDNWGVAPLTRRDKAAGSIAGAFDFKSPPHRAKIIPVGVPPQGQRTLVPVGIIYWCYGGAALFGVLLVAFAARPFRPFRPRRTPAPVPAEVSAGAPAEEEELVS
jgi:phospholipase C